MALTIPRPSRPRLPEGWPRERYIEVARTAKTCLIVWYLLASGTVWAADQATDQIIDSAAHDLAAGPKPPSPTTRDTIRRILRDLIPTPLPDASTIHASDSHLHIAETVMGAAANGRPLEVTTEDGRTLRYELVTPASE
jgi:hypothetical protein